LQLRWGGIPLPEQIVAVEDGLRFEIGTDPRHDFGLFLDGRTARSRVRALAGGALVLNLFSYACGFGVAARAGGARDVVNVDPERSYLSWGRRNAALNGTERSQSAWLVSRNDRPISGAHILPCGNINTLMSIDLIYNQLLF